MDEQHVIQDFVKRGCLRACTVVTSGRINQESKTALEKHDQPKEFKRSFGKKVK